MHSSYKLGKHIMDILKAVHELSLHQKTSKAIRSKKNRIDGMLERTRRRPALTGIDERNNDYNWSLLEMVGSILSLGGSLGVRDKALN